MKKRAQEEKREFVANDAGVTVTPHDNHVSAVEICSRAPCRPRLKCCAGPGITHACGSECNKVPPTFDLEKSRVVYTSPSLLLLKLDVTSAAQARSFYTTGIIKSISNCRSRH